jgi:hypothetical protein
MSNWMGAGKPPGKVDGQTFFGWIQSKRAFFGLIIGFLRTHPATPDGQFRTIEGDGVRGRVDCGIKDHPTGKGEAVQIGLDGERIVLHGDGSDHANLRFYREGFLVVERLKKAR